MTQEYLIDRLTSCSPAEAVAALAVAFEALDGQRPTVAGLACHVAQSALETGHWRSCHWWNFGNVKADASYPLVTRFGCSEILEGIESFFHPAPKWQWPGEKAWLARHPLSRVNDSQCCWRAYRTIEDGAAAQLAFLARRPRYRQAWIAGASGDPRGFATALKAAGYYTADVGHYTRLLESLFRRYRGLCEAALAKPTKPVAEPAPTPEGAGQQRAVDLEAAIVAATLDLKIDWGAHSRAVSEAVLNLDLDPGSD